MESVERFKNVDKNILDSFWTLSDTKKDVRVSSAFSLICTLHNKQRHISSSKASNVSNEVQCSELLYSLERLVKGMCSPRQAARHGFAVSLTEVLRLFSEVSIADVLQLVEKYLPISNKKEKSPMVIGQLLVYSSVVKSGRLASDIEILPLVIKSINELSCERSYIQPASCLLLLDIFTQISEESFKELVWIELKETLSCGWEACSPYILWLLLICQRKYTSAVTSMFLEDKWGCKCIFCPKNYHFMKMIIRQSTDVHPQFHPLCSELLLCISESKERKSVWEHLIDENLFESGQNERAYLGFQFVKEALSRNKCFQKENEFALKKSCRQMMKIAFSPKFCSVFVKCLVSNNHPLHHIGVELACVLETCVKNTTDSRIHIAVIKAFLCPFRASLFRQVLNRKEFGTITMHLSNEAVKNYLEILKNVALGAKEISDEENGVNITQQQCLAAIQIGNLVSHPSTICDIEWRIEVIKLLFLHSFFIIEKPTDDIPQCNLDVDPLPDAVRLTFSHALTKALDSLSYKIDNSSTPLQHMCSSLLSIVEYVQQLLQSSNHVSSIVSLDKIAESWGTVRSMIQRLNKHSKKKDGIKNKYLVFQVLFLHLGLQLFFDPEHIPSILEELQVCCKKAIKTKILNNEAENDDEPSWVQVVVDLMLSLLSQSSHHLRCVVRSAFSLLCPFVTLESLQQVFDVIVTKKETEEDLLIEDSDRDNDEDAEFHSGSSSIEEEQENDADDISALNDLKQKLQRILGPAADGSDEESDAVLTDTEMFELDEALTDVFHTRKKIGHSQLTSEQKTLLHFRIRCLDLIEIYLKSEPPMHLVMKCILPVLSICEFTQQSQHQQPLSQRARSILNNLLKTRKFQHCEEIHDAEMEYIFKELLQKAKKKTNADFQKLVNSLCVYVVLCQKKLDLLFANTKNKEEKLSRFFEQYLIALDNFVKLNNCYIHPEMFKLLMNACPEKAWNFVQPLQEYGFDTNIRLFKKVYCLGLLSSALRLSKAQMSISSSVWLETLKLLMPKAVNVLQSYLGEDSDLKKTYVCELLDIILIIHEICQQKCGKTVIEKHGDLIALLYKIQNKKLNKRGRKLKNRIIFLLTGKTKANSIIGKKQKANTSEQGLNDSEQGLHDSEQGLHDSEQGLNDSEQRANDSEQGLNNSKQGLNDSEQRANDSEQKFKKRKLKKTKANSIIGKKQKANTSEQGLNDSEQGLHDSEKGLHDSEQGLHDSEQGLNDSEQELNDSEQRANDSEQKFKKRKLKKTEANSIIGKKQKANKSEQGVNDSEQRLHDSEQRANDSERKFKKRKLKMTPNANSVIGKMQKANNSKQKVKKRKLK